MDFITILEALATILCIIGVIYGTIPKRKGLWYLIIGTLIWMLFAFLTDHWYLFSQEVFLLALNIISLKTWKTQGIPF